MSRLVVSETATSTWHYHLRDQDSEDMIAMCGEKLGWDTELPVSWYEARANGAADHVPTRCCKKCLDISNKPG